MILTENARLRLRTMCRDDLEELYALLSDAEVMRWLEPPFTREQAERFLQHLKITILISSCYFISTWVVNHL